MPDATTFGGDPIPTGPEGAWVPGSLMAYAESIDPKLIHAATSQADRDARFATLPAGSLVTWEAGGTVWLKLASGWQAIISDTGWVTSGVFTYPSADWTAGSYARVRNRNGLIDVRFEVIYAGVTTAYPTGDISPNVTVATIASTYRFTSFGGVLSTTGFSHSVGYSFAVTSTGEFRLVAVPPGESVTNGGLLDVSITYLEG